jgi:hypothetical protein
MYRKQISLLTNLICDRLCLDLHKSDFLYYDKDGFELNLAEQKYYRLMGHQLSHCLNHNTLAQTWYTSNDPGLIIDHSLILYRCGFGGDAAKQLTALKTCVPQASLLLHTEAKWGFDFALDSIDSQGNLFEVIHIEYDSKNFQQFQDRLNTIQQGIDSIDWQDAAKDILAHRSHWQSLTGFAQNDWKAQRILNWQRAEYTEKAY